LAATVLVTSKMDSKFTGWADISSRIQVSIVHSLTHQVSYQLLGSVAKLHVG
jgi:hypothetical protein